MLLLLICCCQGYLLAFGCRRPRINSRAQCFHSGCAAVIRLGLNAALSWLCPTRPRRSTEIICCMCEVFVGSSAASFIIRIDELISREQSRQTQGRQRCLALSKGNSEEVLRRRFNFSLSALPHMHSQLRFHKTIEKPPRLHRVGGGDFS